MLEYLGYPTDDESQGIGASEDDSAEDQGVSEPEVGKHTDDSAEDYDDMFERGLACLSNDSDFEALFSHDADDGDGTMTPTTVQVWNKDDPHSSVSPAGGTQILPLQYS